MDESKSQDGLTHMTQTRKLDPIDPTRTSEPNREGQNDQAKRRQTYLRRDMVADPVKGATIGRKPGKLRSDPD
jgi:hypothetical protein